MMVYDGWLWFIMVYYGLLWFIMDTQILQPWKVHGWLH